MTVVTAALTLVPLLPAAAADSTKGYRAGHKPTVKGTFRSETLWGTDGDDVSHA